MMTNIPPFIEIPVSADEPARCMDGRPSLDITRGAQMPGGSLFPLALLALIKNTTLDKQLIQSGIELLTNSGYRIGIHRGSQQSSAKGTSDCGFADTLPVLTEQAVTEKEQVIQRLHTLMTTFKKQTDIFTPSLPRCIEQSCLLLDRYQLREEGLSGEALIASVEQEGAVIEHTQGIHKECVGFVNLKPGTTLDTRQLNLQGDQAFNVDLWFVRDMATSLGFDPHIAVGIALMFYQIAAIVLIEGNGQPAIPIVIR